MFGTWIAMHYGQKGLKMGFGSVKSKFQRWQASETHLNNNRTYISFDKGFCFSAKKLYLCLILIQNYIFGRKTMAGTIDVKIFEPRRNFNFKDLGSVCPSCFALSK